MTTSRSQGARSLHGCWTCRLRRKKCDETHPNCSICSGLRLICSGYGPRPTWMDGGEAEKEQAASVKRLIKSNKRSSKELHQSSSAPIDLVNPPLGLLTPSPTVSRFSQPGTISQYINSEDNNDWLLDDQGLPSCDFTDMDLDESYFNSSLENSFGTQGHSFNFDDIPLEDLTQTHPPFTVLTENLNTVHPSLPSNTEFVPAASSSLANTNNNPPHLTAGIESSSGDSSSDSQESTAQDNAENQESDTSQADLPTPKVPEHREPPAWKQTSFGNSILDIGERHDEAKWFLHYLDRVFYVIFPFYDSSGIEGCRGWILNLLVRDRSFYYAALALGQYHFRSTHSSSEQVELRNKATREGDNYHNLALQGIRHAIGQTHTRGQSDHLIRKVQALACSLHLLFFEILDGASGPWQTHLQISASLIPDLAEVLISEAPKEVTVWDNESTLSSEDRIAGSLILSALIWLDILAGASNSSRPLLKIDHILLLEHPTIGAKVFSGCENWVLSSIFKISELNAWKKDAQRKHILSVAELARRGSQIQTDLVARLESSSLPGVVRTPVQSPEARTPFMTDSKISQIFGLAALTYLHVTVSGANYQLPEIVESVSKTAAAFSGLNDTKYLRHLVWPFCVSACMASGEQQKFFRRLGVTIHQEHRMLGAGKQALKIVEECWKLREPSNSFDWMSAMGSLGKCIILA